MVKDSGQGISEVLFCLEAVMKNHNGSRSGVSDDVPKALLRVDRGIKIGTQDVPHNDPVMSEEKLSLPWPDAAIGWPEQVGLDEWSAFSHIVQVRNVI
jgi:hypothetical protein